MTVEPPDIEAPLLATTNKRKRKKKWIRRALRNGWPGVRYMDLVALGHCYPAPGQLQEYLGEKAFEQYQLQMQEESRRVHGR